MKKFNEEKISKWLSLVLRHEPEKAELKLDAQGWACLDLLLEQLHKKNHIGLEELRSIVKNNNKQRFELDEPNNRIRARQGHSVAVDLGLLPDIPSGNLYHGAPLKCWRGFEQRAC